LYSKLEQRLSAMVNAGTAHLLAGGRIGLEKESLRVSPDGGIAKTPHPSALGSALTNSYFTTDYSEAQTEFITPPFDDGKQALAFLRDGHKFVYDNLQDEILWATSMPCVLAGGANIPVARYGNSNAGRMKTVYRRGLGHRYGRAMQVISGVHFNFSLNEALWPSFQDLEQDRGNLRTFIDKHYFRMLRNLQRHGWLVPYLFGASPAVCMSFVGDKETRLSVFNDTTYYEPFATSLRMGDIGYSNSKELGAGIDICYDSIDTYIKSLSHAIEAPCATWGEKGTLVDGSYRQLNSNILQIENEHYSTVRPKQLTGTLEKPVLALQKRGVRYVELRSLDVNAFHPLGISEEQLCFLEAFLMFCLLHESPPLEKDERPVVDRNLELVAHRGRDSSIRLLRQGREGTLQDWAREICSDMAGICEQLDGSDRTRPYSSSLTNQLEVIRDPDRTPSAMVLAEMRANGEGFFPFARRMSQQHKTFFDSQELSLERRQLFETEARRSMDQQREMEEADRVPFDQFLEDYFNQI